MSSGVLFLGSLFVMMALPAHTVSTSPPLTHHHLSRCVEEAGVVARIQQGWTKHILEGDEESCCTICESDPSCQYALSTGADCYVSQTLGPHEIQLQGSSYESQKMRLVWMDDSEKRGNFCERCDCRPEQQLIDCRGRNLTVVPKDFLDEITWVPVVLDLRDNPFLGLLGSGALESIGTSLRQLRLPDSMKHIGSDAIRGLQLESLEFENELNHPGNVFLNNVISKPTDAFADVCCNLGESVWVGDRNYQFCSVEPEAPGIDSVYFDFINSVDSGVLSLKKQSSSFMSEAAESREKCAEYCTVSSGCNYFAFDARIVNAENLCYLLSDPGRYVRVCCFAEHFADAEETLPGWTSGMPPRTRHNVLDARVIVEQADSTLNLRNSFQTEYQVRLGTMPLRGAVWVEPKIVDSRGYIVSVSPNRIILYNNETTATVSVEAHGVQPGSEGGTVTIQNSITSCDKAFSEVSSTPGNANIHFDVMAPALAVDDSLNRTMLISVLCLVGILVVAMSLLLNKKDADPDGSMWKVTRSELHFGDPPEILGRGTFGLVLLAEYRSTNVAVKRVIPPKKKKKRSDPGQANLPKTLSSNFTLEDQEEADENGSDGEETLETASSGRTGIASGTVSQYRAGGSLTSSGVFQHSQMKRDFLYEMRLLSRLHHPNITTVMGAVIEQGVEPMLLMEYMEHGSLHDLLKNETIILDTDLLLPILADVVAGIRFLHASDPPMIHGDLKAANILVDKKFRAKVADFGLSQKKNVGGTGTPFWMAPELLRKESQNTRMSDIYSFGIILYEAFSRREPYEGLQTEMVLRQVADTTINLRPPLPDKCPQQVRSMMADCIVNNPSLRPSAAELSARLQRVQTEVDESAGKSAVSLKDIFPPHIAEALQAGRAVEAEHKECVTIFFSEVVNFASLSGTLAPQKVASMLDRLYHSFDELSLKYDIFKVETIGDEYMAVTNLIKDQSTDHTMRVAQFAMEAIQSASCTLIDEDDKSLGYVQLRVGFHSGPVVADVVGNRNPRYCLFGDTVNTASRMKTSSEANRIQCSTRSAVLLEEQAPSIELQARGEIEIKGKGEMFTFWVHDITNGSATCQGSIATNPMEPIVEEGSSELSQVDPSDIREETLSASREQEATKSMPAEVMEAHPESSHPPRRTSCTTSLVEADRLDIDFGSADSKGEFLDLSNRLKERLLRNHQLTQQASQND